MVGWERSRVAAAEAAAGAGDCEAGESEVAAAEDDAATTAPISDDGAGDGCCCCCCGDTVSEALEPEGDKGSAAFEGEAESPFELGLADVASEVAVVVGGC